MGLLGPDPYFGVAENWWISKGRPFFGPVFEEANTDPLPTQALSSPFLRKGHGLLLWPA